MLGVASGSILVPLNSTMLAVALPGVMDEFGLPASTVTSLVSLYLGAVAIALPVGGALGDRFGSRRVFLAGVLGFGAASLVAALASSFVVLEVARVLQAASGALVSTSSATLIRETAPADRRGETFGLFDLLTSTSAAIGPFIGGVIVGAFGGKLFETDQQVRDNLAAVRDRCGQAPPSVALFGGGLGPHNAADQILTAGGGGLLILLGSQAYRYPGGIEAGVRATVAAVRAAVDQ